WSLPLASSFRSAVVVVVEDGGERVHRRRVRGGDRGVRVSVEVILAEQRHRLVNRVGSHGRLAGARCVLQLSGQKLGGQVERRVTCLLGPLKVCLFSRFTAFEQSGAWLGGAVLPCRTT